MSTAGMGTLDRLVARALPVLPRALVWRVARRYIAGESLEDAVRVITSLGSSGLRATVDYLGEGVEREEEAAEARQAYCAVLESLHAHGLRAGISVKLTQLGLKLDPAVARANLEILVARAGALGRFVRIDMEDSSVTSETIAIYREARQRHRNVGLVLQAYLRRTEEDARALAPLAPDVRICKGIYAEPPELVFPDPEDVRRNFLKVIRILLEGGGRAAIATHDGRLVDDSIRLTDELKAGPDRHEFQMLLGVGEALRSRITSSGRTLRVYVPFGRHWHPYSLRRLRENPRIAGYVFRDLLASPLRAR